MRRLLQAVAAALVAAGCASNTPAPAPAAKAQPSAPPPSRAPGPVALRNPDMALVMPSDARCAPGWTCTMHADPNSFRFTVDTDGGKRALCVEPVKKEPWAIVAQTLSDASLRGTRMRFTIATRLAYVGGKGAGPWVQVQRGRQPRQTFEKLASDSGDWQAQSLEFDVADDAISVEVGMVLRGTGRACFGEARLEVLRPAKNPV